MNVLILGSGGREHAFAWKIKQSNLLNKLYVAPGNAGTAQIATNLNLNLTNFSDVKQVVINNNIQMLIVGSEQPLVDGIHDFFLNDLDLKHVSVIGPQKLAAQLEGSKEFSKKFMMRHNIPTAAYQSFTKATLEQGQRFLETLKPPFVLKADGLAAGKGVLILPTLEEAKKELTEMLSNNKFGAASTKVVIEEFLDGIEMSCFVLTDGNNYVTLPNAKDYKRIGEGDTGLNTGGMGAISPVPFASDGFLEKIQQQIIKPTIDGLKKDNIPYQGFIFFGIIKVGNNPMVIEYNCRMGDPETEVVIPRLQTDLLQLFKDVADQNLKNKVLQIDKRSATTVMLVSGGYPESYKKGMPISGIEKVTNSLVFHAGTKLDNKEVKTNGGRVIAVTSFGIDFKQALQKSYESIHHINFEAMCYRTDIGFDL